MNHKSTRDGKCQNWQLLNYLILALPALVIPSMKLFHCDNRPLPLTLVNLAITERLKVMLNVYIELGVLPSTSNTLRYGYLSRNGPDDKKGGSPLWILHPIGDLGRRRLRGKIGDCGIVGLMRHAGSVGAVLAAVSRRRALTWLGMAVAVALARAQRVCFAIAAWMEPCCFVLVNDHVAQRLDPAWFNGEYHDADKQQNYHARQWAVDELFKGRHVTVLAIGHFIVHRYIRVAHFALATVHLNILPLSLLTPILTGWLARSTEHHVADWGFVLGVCRPGIWSQAAIGAFFNLPITQIGTAVEFVLVFEIVAADVPLVFVKTLSDRRVAVCRVVQGFVVVTLYAE